MAKNTSQDIKKLNIRCFDAGEGRVNLEIPKTDYIKEHFNDNISPSHLVLDCGCGIGSVLLSLDCTKIGLDISKENLKKRRPLKENINFVQGDAESLPFKDKAIDAVILAAALHHFPNYERNIKEVSRVLKDGGKAYIIEGNSIGLLPVSIPLWPLNIIRKMRGTYPEYEIHAGKISLTKVTHLLKINHFTISKLYGDNTFICTLTEKDTCTSCAASMKFVGCHTLLVGKTAAPPARSQVGKA